MSMLTLGVLASGRGSNLQAILSEMRAGRLAVRLGVVISNKKEAQALHHAKECPSLFIDPAAYPTREDYDVALLQTLQEHHADLVVLAGYMRWVTSVLIAPYRNRIINIHPSLLPSFPGLHAQRQALAHGVKISGCTVHIVDETMDHGPIIAQSAVAVREDDSETSLSDRILEQEHRLLPEAIGAYVNGKIHLDGRRVWVGPLSGSES